MGTENIKKVLSFIIGLGERVDAVTKEDSAGGSKITVSEWLGSLGQLIGVPALIKAIPKVSEEFEDLDDAEYDELVAWFAAELDLSNDKVEDIIEIAFQVALELAEIALSFKKNVE